MPGTNLFPPSAWRESKVTLDVVHLSTHWNSTVCHAAEKTPKHLSSSSTHPGLSTEIEENAKIRKKLKVAKSSQ
jgi:hypothetical protein